MSDTAVPSNEAEEIELAPVPEGPAIPLRDVREHPAVRPVTVIPLLVFSTYFLLKPFYFVSSGKPQPGDFLAMVLLGTILTVGTAQHQPRTTRLLFFASLFVAYAALVNMSWALLLGNVDLLWGPLFLAFNLALFCLCLLMADCYGERFFRYTLVAVGTSLILQALLSQVAPTATRRQVIFFENPNQLGYWTLLSTSIFFLCTLRIRVHWAIKLVVTCASLYLVALSLSKAAIAAMLALCGLVFVVRPRYLMLLLPIAALAPIVLAGTQLEDNLLWRFDTLGQADDNLAVRGYSMLFDFPQYLFFGAGEGAFERFRVWSSREFHSTLGTILFSYGMLGLTFFGLLIHRIYREAGLYRCAVLAPAFLYGATHQGLRFSLLWALFAVAACAAVPAPAEPRREAS
jgi:hypothetical protein